jgi:hypothetical protein
MKHSKQYSLINKINLKMKDLSALPALKAALAQIVTESDVDNGTAGMEFYAYWYATEYIHNPERDALTKEIATAVLKGDYEKVLEKQEALKKLAKPEIMMEWRLLEPMKSLKGTKLVTIKRGEDTKKYELNMKDVKSIYVSQMASKMKLIQWEDTDEVREDSQGRESKVLRMKLVKGLVDVAAPVFYGKKEVRGKRAYVTPISYRALQTAGSMMFKERIEESRIEGFDLIA